MVSSPGDGLAPVAVPPGRAEAPISRTPARGRRRRGGGRAAADGLSFIAPFLAVYVLFVVLPVAQAVLMSAYDWDLLGATRDYIGLDNFERMLWGTDMTWSLGHLWPLRLVLLLAGGVLVARAVRRGTWTRGVVLAAATTVLLVGVLGVHPSAQGAWNDPAFWVSLRHTIEFTLISTPVLVALGLAMALALHGRRRGTAFYRAVFFLPYVLPISVTTLIWGYLLHPDRGILASYLGWFGIEPIAWLSDPSLAMPAIIVTTVWWTVGFNLVLFLAGLQDIDPSLHEAASLDGANSWQRFRHITVPGLRHVTVLVVVTQLIASFQIFGQVYIMTRGGPGDSTRVLIQHVYEAGFRDFELGYASAVSLFLFAMMLVVSAVQFRLLRREAR
jgi:multiple sugar transport system permease protein